MAFLNGRKVLDVSDYRGAPCGRVLADLGAEVVTVDRAGGAALPAARDLPGRRYRH